MLVGDSEGGVEILSIDLAKKGVVMTISGSVTNVTFPTTETAAAPPGKPGVTGLQTAALPNITKTGLAGMQAGGLNSGGGSPVVLSSRNNQSTQRGVSVAGAPNIALPTGSAAVGAGAPAVSYNASATAAARNNGMPNRIPRTLANPNTPNNPNNPNTQAPAAQPSLTPDQLNRLMLFRKAQNPGLPFPVSPQDQQGIEQILNEGR
jgi:hypothetical protein